MTLGTKLQGTDLRLVSPLEVTTYLKTHGWKQTGDIRRATVWTHKTGAEVLVPSQSSTADYNIRIAELLQGIEEVEHRPARKILADLLPRSVDIVRLRLEAPFLADGTIPIEAALSAITHVRDLFLAVASWVTEPAYVHLGRKPREVLDYMSRVRLAPPERGSFVVVAQSPLPVAYAEMPSAPVAALPQPREPVVRWDVPSLVPVEPVGDVPHEPGPVLPPPAPWIEPWGPWQAHEPYARQVTLTLANAVQTASGSLLRAAKNNTLGEFLRDGVRRGISANLCDALANLLQNTDASSIEIAFEWSPLRPAAVAMRKVARFEEGEVHVLREAARQLREGPPHEGIFAVVGGKVVRLARERGREGGEITIRHDESGRRVRIRLAGHDYGTAVAAHDQDLKVRCEGTLERVGNRTVLTNPQNFAIVRPLHRP